MGLLELRAAWAAAVAACLVRPRQRPLLITSRAVVAPLPLSVLVQMLQMVDRHIFAWAAAAVAARLAEAALLPAALALVRWPVAGQEGAAVVHRLNLARAE